MGGKDTQREPHQWGMQTSQDDGEGPNNRCQWYQSIRIFLKSFTLKKNKNRDKTKMNLISQAFA